jgi:hypothetical protein
MQRTFADLEHIQLSYWIWIWKPYELAGVDEDVLIAGMTLRS